MNQSLSRSLSILAGHFGGLLLVGNLALAQAADVTAPGDPIAGVAALPGSSTSSLATPGVVPNYNNYPNWEGPTNAIDDDPFFKYLNFQIVNAGFIVTPSEASVLSGLRFTTGNDSPERDPMTVVIEGTNDANATLTLNSSWVTVYIGPSGLATDPGRDTPGAVMSFSNGASFKSYRLLVLSVRDIPGPANSFQFGEVELRGAIGAGGSGFCFGDGSGAACPCGNASAPGSQVGCLNSLGTGGRLVAAGSSSLSSDGLQLSGSQMPNSFALYYQGTTQTAGGLGIVFGDGLRCGAGSIVRLGIAQNVAGSSVYPVAPQPAISLKGNVLAPGTRTYQVWYRNAAPYCSVSTFNLTNGCLVTWTT